MTLEDIKNRVNFIFQTINDLDEELVELQSMCEHPNVSISETMGVSVWLCEDCSKHWHTKPDWID